jgi:hypothetical protein
MPLSNTRRDTYFADLEGMEARIAASLETTADELAHAECFDQEQRAEIYAILQALRNDSTNHQQMVRLLAARMEQGPTHA